MSTWLLLRGLTREAGHWGEFPRRLGERLPEARVVALDLPGNGRLFRQPSPLRVEAMAEACRTELAARWIHVKMLELESQARRVIEGDAGRIERCEKIVRLWA